MENKFALFGRLQTHSFVLAFLRIRGSEFAIVFFIDLKQNFNNSGPLDKCYQNLLS